MQTADFHDCFSLSTAHMARFAVAGVYSFNHQYESRGFIRRIQAISLLTVLLVCDHLITNKINVKPAETSPRRTKHIPYTP